MVTGDREDLNYVGKTVFISPIDDMAVKTAEVEISWKMVIAIEEAYTFMKENSIELKKCGISDLCMLTLITGINRLVEGNFHDLCERRYKAAKLADL